MVDVFALGLSIYLKQQAKLIPLKLRVGATWLYVAAVLLLLTNITAELVAHRVLRVRAEHFLVTCSKMESRAAPSERQSANI